jgi:hypothetical protein
MMLRVGARLVTVALLLLVAGTAHGQNAAAEALYRTAVELAQAGNFKEACPKFKASYELDPQLGTLYALAACHEEEGRTATAWAEYNEAVSLALRTNKPATADEAQKKAAELKPRLSNLVFSLDKQIPEMTVTLDGKQVPIAAMGQELPVDPGEHEVLAEAPRHKSWSKKLSVPKGPHVATVRIPELVRLAPEPDRPVVQSGLNDFQVVGYTLGALGLVGLTLGTIFGIVASMESNDADDHCINNFCTEEGLDGHDRALAFAHISTIGFVVGGAALGTGIILVLTAPSPAATDAEPTAWGLQIGGTW